MKPKKQKTEIILVETNSNHKDGIAKAQAEGKILACWQVLKIWKENPERLDKIPKWISFWCSDGASYLYWLDGVSRFGAYDWGVDLSGGRLRGVIVERKMIL